MLVEEKLGKPEDITVNKQCCRISTLNAPSSLCRPSRSVVVEALAGLLKVAVAFLCCGEPRLCQILPVEGAATQLLSLALGPGPLDGQQVDIARQGNSPSGEAPGQAQLDIHRPGQVQREGNRICYRKYGCMMVNCYY